MVIGTLVRLEFIVWCTHCLVFFVWLCGALVSGLCVVVWYCGALVSGFCLFVLYCGAQVSVIMW